MSNLTSAEWASWVQAIGSVLAIIAATMIAICQSRWQHNNAMKLHKEEQRYAQLELAKTLSVLAKNCAKAVAYSAEQLRDRDAIYRVATKELYFDLGEIQRIDDAIAGIPLYSLPSTLVTFTMILNATVRQFREKVETALRCHRDMDANAFADLFHVFAEMNESIEKTCHDIETEVSRVQNETKPT